MSPRSQSLSGVRLPDVLLPATAGPGLSLAQVEGLAVVCIYPYTGRPGVADPPGWDLIPGAHGSTAELEGFRDLAQAFEELGFELIALSGQSTDWQREMANRLRLPFPVLSDAGLAFADAFGLPRFETGGVAYLERLTLAVENGVVARVFHPVRDPAGHAAEVLAAMKSERFFAQRP
jgi:peroxiredoxin